MINALSEAPEGVHHRPCAQFLQKEAFLNPTSVILHRRDIFSARQPTMLASLINPGSIPRRSETLNLHFLHPSPFLKRSRTGSICMSSASFKRFEPKTLEKLADGTLGDYPAEDLLWGIGNAPFDLLMAAAGVARDRRSDANVMTFSPKVFIPLTRACRNSCGYCTFCSAAETGSENVPELGRSAGNCAQWSKSRLQRGAFYVGRQARASLSGTHGGVISHVGIIMGSDSDLPVMKDAAEVLDSFQVPYEIAIVSAHRTPKRLVEYAQQAHERGVKVIIAGAGGAAHLPGMVASMTLLPVIGVPLIASSLDGMDSLLSIVQMPKGVPVATVAIQNATNAALLAIRILGSTDSNLQEKLCQYQIDMNETVLKKTEKLETVGWKAYLS